MSTGVSNLSKYFKNVKMMMRNTRHAAERYTYTDVCVCLTFNWYILVCYAACFAASYNSSQCQAKLKRNEAIDTNTPLLKETPRKTFLISCNAPTETKIHGKRETVFGNACLSIRFLTIKVKWHLFVWKISFDAHKLEIHIWLLNFSAEFYNKINFSHSLSNFEALLSSSFHVKLNFKVGKSFNLQR